DGLADSPPKVTEQLDHPETSIHFAQLAEEAARLGLGVELRRLDEVVGFDLGARQLWRPHYEGLRAMCAAAGQRLAARAWTPESLAERLPFPVDLLRWVRLDEPGPGPLVTRFWALILTKRR